MVEHRENVFILDIRPQYSFEEEHIPDSHNLPIYGQLKGENFIGLDASLDDLPEDRMVVVVCFSGSTAAIAAEYLRGQGFNAKAMDGGIGAWTSTTVGTNSAVAA